MIESTARAERYDLQTSLSPFYLWEVPQKPVSVRIPFSLIDRLERDAVESFRSLTSKGSEIGGLLVGGVIPGSPLVVSIADYELIPCDYSRGPLYRLSDADMGRFERAIEQRVGSGAAIAGFFRSQTRKGLSLDADDLTFFEARFRDPHQIALLVRPFATKASTGGVFIWENGKINGEASYLEFPFRSSELGPGNIAAPEPPESKAGATQAPKAPARGQIVPIASRREISIPQPSAPEPAPPVAAAPAPAPAAPTPAPATAAAAPAVEAKPAVTEDKSAKPAKADKSEKADKSDKADKNDKFDRSGKSAKTEKSEKNDKIEKAEKIEAPAKPEKQEKKEAAAGALSLKSTPVADPAPAKSGKSVKLLVAAAASIILFVSLFVYPGFLRTHATKPAAVTGSPQDSSPLQLRVERTAGELLITWNRDSDAIKNASKAVLSISDGEQHENVEMDLAQLRNGSIVYSPSSIDTSFKMEVIDKTNTKTASESVRVLRTRPSPLEAQPAPNTPATPATTNTKPAATETKPPAADAAEETPAEAPRKLASPSKPFQTESLSQRLRPAVNTDMPEAPSVGGSGNSFASAIPGVSSSAVAPAPVAPAAPSTPAAAAPTGVNNANAKAGGQIQQAVLVYRKEAEYPKIAKQTGAKGVVTLNATITKDGTVKNVKVVSGHPMLVNAAAEAVRQWRYKPTLLNGQPVETDTQILVNFVGEK